MAPNVIRLINNNRRLFVNTNTGCCKNLLSEILANQKDLNEIISSYYESLEPRYLCVFEFDDSQLTRYVLLSEKFGNNVPIYDDYMKKKIQEIKKEYVTNPAIANGGPTGMLQSRILVTTPKSIEPYITHILEPTNTIYSNMKKNIIEVINKQKQVKRIAAAAVGISSNGQQQRAAAAGSSSNSSTSSTSSNKLTS